jgi:hypothetical protein
MPEFRHTPFHSSLVRQSFRVCLWDAGLGQASLVAAPLNFLLESDSLRPFIDFLLKHSLLVENVPPTVLLKRVILFLIVLLIRDAQLHLIVAVLRVYNFLRFVLDFVA